MSEESIQCWSCGTRMTLDELASNDGDCPECSSEIALAEYLAKALADNNELRTQLASTGGEAVAWKRRDGVMGCKRFMTQKCYDAQSPQMKGNYEPFHCANCAAMQPATAGLVVTHDHLMALLEHCDTIERAGESFTEIKPETLRALCSALLNQAGGGKP